MLIFSTAAHLTVGYVSVVLSMFVYYRQTRPVLCKTINIFIWINTCKSHFYIDLNRQITCKNQNEFSRWIFDDMMVSTGLALQCFIYWGGFFSDSFCRLHHYSSRWRHMYHDWVTETFTHLQFIKIKHWFVQ